MNIDELQLPIASARLLLRRLRVEDLPSLYEIESDPIVKAFIVGGPVVDGPEVWLRKAKSLLSSDDTLALEDRGTSRLAGRASLGHFVDNLNPLQREVQVVLARSFIGFGLGVEATRLLCGVAFEQMAATSVFAIVHPQHPASFRLLEELHFVEVAPRSAESGAVVARVFELAG